MTISRIFILLGIIATATVAWFALGTATSMRSTRSDSQLRGEVRQVWGPGLSQPHLQLITDSNDTGTVAEMPGSTRVEADVRYHPKKRGLLWHRTYDVAFTAQYMVSNASASPRNVKVRLLLPSKETSYQNFKFQLGKESSTQISPKDGVVETALLMPANAEMPLTVAYEARGLDRWSYTFPADSRVKDFSLHMKTDFNSISFPAGSTSPSKQTPATQGPGWELEWNYADTIAAQDIAVDMPRILNAGPVITRITFFAPLSLFFFFGVVVLGTMLRGINLHPMTCIFMTAGFFAFHLLLAYLADQISLHLAFTISAAVSVALVCGYVHLVAGKALSLPTLAAQLVYMVLFSYSFFYPGRTGLVLTVMGIATLALLMVATAGVDWEKVLPRQVYPWGTKPGIAPASTVH